MKSYPLVRIRWSNEHIMAALFIVLLLYMLPVWLDKPREFLEFLPVLALALVFDAVSGFLRYKRPVCSVSAAVTAGMLQVLTPGMPLWGRLIGIAAALLIGKHIWGGTGKNIINPALTGVLLLGFIFKFQAPFTEAPLLYLPALVLSLPFLLFRPFAGLGLVAGLSFSMLSSGNFNIGNIIISCIFFGCLAVTDPVTVTHKPAAGFIGAFAAGFTPYALTGSVFYLAAGILIFNLFSYLIELRAASPKKLKYNNLTRIKKVFGPGDYSNDVLDLTGERAGESENNGITAPEEILESIDKHGVYGMGGAGFPAAKKLKALIETKASEKYLIINAAECDPGLIHDKWLLKNRIKDIEKGIELIGSCSEFKRIILAAKDISGIKTDKGFEIIQVQDMYPAGAEKVLIKSVLGIELEQDAIPASKGILVLNVQTVLSIYEAVRLNKDANTRYITIADLKDKKSRKAKVAKVRLGERIHDALGKAYPGGNLVFAGGGIMQAHMAAEEDVIDKSVNFIAAANLPKYKESPQCSHCGLCRNGCPAGLESGRIAELVDAGHISETVKYEPSRCMECGTCSYVCLAGKDLSSRVREAKRYCK